MPGVGANWRVRRVEEQRGQTQDSLVKRGWLYIYTTYVWQYIAVQLTKYLVVGEEGLEVLVDLGEPLLHDGRLLGCALRLSLLDPRRVLELGQVIENTAGGGGGGCKKRT